MATITLPTAELTDWEAFHSVCQRAFGFPDFYGRNMDAWTDCLSSLDDAKAALTSIRLRDRELLVLVVPDSAAFQQRAPEVFSAFLVGTADVNRRFLERGGTPRLALLLA